MALAQEDIDYIDAMIRKVLTEIPQRTGVDVRHDQELRERTIRVEEELKHQRELMLEGFKQMEKRFEQIEKRFEQVDKRFEQMISENNARFEQIDKRFAQMINENNARFEQIDKRFEQMISENKAHFEQVDSRFEQMIRENNARFEQIEKHLVQITARMDRFMFWSLGLTVSAVVAVVKLI